MVMILIFIVTFPLFQLPLPNLQTPPTDQKPEGGMENRGSSQ